MIGVTNINGIGNFIGNKAVLKIFADIDSTIMVSKGLININVVKNLIDPTNNNYAYWFFETNDFGTWTITATKNNYTLTKEILINGYNQYDVYLDYDYLIFDGSFRHDLRFEQVTDLQNGIVSGLNSASVYVTGQQTLGAYLNKPIDLTNYSTACIECEYNFASNYATRMGFWPPTASDAFQYNSNSVSNSAAYYSKNYGFVRDTYTIDISSLTGEYIFKIIGISGGTNNIYIFTMYNMYLTRSSI